MNSNNNFKVGIYIRLSKEDKGIKNESESVINQRNLIYSFINSNGFKMTNEYIDDGYTGTTFDRPQFNRLLDDIENNKINCVITKDLSRLGRDYIKSGYYLEEYFPIHHVRYISILDNIDTYFDSSNNEIAPFKALFNDMVSKDTSKKIKSILRNKKESGLFLGSKAPYGYVKKRSNKHKLIIDKYASKIVKKIYELSYSNYSKEEIARILNEEKVLSPAVYKGLKKTGLWSGSSVNNILNNVEYTGCLVQNVWTNYSYKNKKRKKNIKEEWSVVYNTHRAIIDKEIFDSVKNTQKNIVLKKKREKLLLEGLVFCDNCGCLLGANYNKRWFLVCNGYKRNRKKCSSHYMNYQTLEKEVLKCLNSHMDIEPINRNLIFLLIDKILVNTNREVTIYYKFIKDKTSKG